MGGNQRKYHFRVACLLLEAWERDNSLKASHEPFADMFEKHRWNIDGKVRELNLKDLVNVVRTLTERCREIEAGDDDENRHEDFDDIALINIALNKLMPALRAARAAFVTSSDSSQHVARSDGPVTRLFSFEREDPAFKRQKRDAESSPVGTVH